MQSAKRGFRSEPQSTASPTVCHHLPDASRNTLAAPQQIKGGQYATAFSLIEIIIAVGLMTVIMLGLMMMFNQTQRAFQAGMTQTDVLEAGRAAVGLVSHDLEQMTASDRAEGANFWLQNVPGWPPLSQPLPGGNGVQRTYLLQDMFILTRENQTWRGIGYFVRAEDGGRLRLPRGQAYNNPQQLLAGQLYRFDKTLPVADSEAPRSLFTNFLSQVNPDQSWATNIYTSRVADGVLDFKARAYDSSGRWIAYPPLPPTSTNVIARSNIILGEVDYYLFSSNALPASVEFELGLLEDRAWQRYNALPDGATRYRYLTNQIGRVHIFRQRVSVPNFDPAAYQ
jgi:hypothetical protein